MTVTIAEVAAAADVSTSTVSRCFAQPDAVRADTRERVLEAARRLGYTPNRIARSLAVGRTRTLGLIVPDIGNLFFASIAKAVQARARAKDYAVFLADTDEQPGDEAELALTMAKQVDGLLLVAPRMSEDELTEVVAAAPAVLLNRRMDGVSSVAAAGAEGVRMAAEHVRALGHRHLALILGARNSWSSMERSRAARQACEELGLQLTEFGPLPPKFGSGVGAADLVLAAGPTAVVAHNDMVALGLISRFAERGVRVPDDMSVVGCDDTLLARTATPSLTSVSIPLDSLGRQAVDLMVRTLDQPGHRPAPAETVLESGLTVRRSTGPLRTQAAPPTATTTQPHRS
ncbi:LacI family transcriptional regulator [Mangrovactinospora gilvigrisea]|uniref:LacI family transcriptional regulator n=1 Tax=Mangrovactinospora gilvigrisea TaxID=1428644 RepID=A0A1J7BQZ3_9ACTN|nr:LacI family DNA-binding transcriptional regulator [Mangrovactinospora gilvigrisea]OIV35865.1 LacI family transcriptional regulator [Mangrovactinospora gilvigrisea]